MADIGNVVGSEIFGDDFVPSEPEAPEVPDTPALTIDANDRPRTPDGRFASTKEAEEAPEAEAEEEPGDETEPSEPEDAEEAEAEAEGDGDEVAPDGDQEDLVLESDDEEVLALLDKYDGDVVKALKAATEAQSLIGRQGQELGELRTAMEEALDERLQVMQREIIAQSIDWDDQIENNPRRAAEMALNTANIDMLVAALQAWEEEDGSAEGPVLFLRAAQAEVALQQAQYEQAQPAPDPTAEFAAEMDAFKQRHPDVQQHLPAIQKIVSERPTLARALNEGTAKDRATALEDALLLARSQSLSSDTSASARRVILRAQKEANAAKAEAVVETASNTSAASAGPSDDEVLQTDLRTLTGLDDLVVV